MKENTVLRKIFANAMKIKAKVEYQYIDCDETWTVPIRLNPKLAEEILSDASIKKARLIFDTDCL
jgi:hypothetical protein